MNLAKFCNTKYGMYVAFGVGLGTAIGVALDHMELSMGLGAIFGAVTAFLGEKLDKGKGNEDA